MLQPPDVSPGGGSNELELGLGGSPMSREVGPGPGLLGEGVSVRSSTSWVMGSHGAPFPCKQTDRHE